MVYEQDHIDHAKALLAAMEQGPTATDLETVPLLDLWQAAVAGDTGMPFLWGYAIGHPLLRNGNITTSPLIALGEDLSWARTRSRWYRLGTPMNEVEEKFGAYLAAKGPGSRYIPAALPMPSMPIAGERLRRKLKDVRALLRGVIAE